MSRIKDYVQHALLIAVCAFVVMIAIGMWHDIWPKVPPLGYWPCLGIAIGLYGLAWLIHSPRLHGWLDKRGKRP